MIDIEFVDGELAAFDSDVYRATNLLSIQIGNLEYAQDFGIDLNYFLTQNIQFQNESFKAYLVERLANRGINVSSIVDELETLFTTYTINVSPNETSTSMVAR